jgi:hypothetical protein
MDLLFGVFLLFVRWGFTSTCGQVVMVAVSLLSFAAWGTQNTGLTFISSIALAICGWRLAQKIYRRTLKLRRVWPGEPHE